MEDKTTVVTMRVIDFANPAPGTWILPCNECGELTWISSAWKNKKICQVVCKPCWVEKYKNADYTACVEEKDIEQALQVLRDRNIYTTREVLIKNMENEIGRKIKIVRTGDASNQKA